MKIDPLNLQIQTHTVEKMLEPLIIQVCIEVCPGIIRQNKEYKESSQTLDEDLNACAFYFMSYELILC